LDIPPVVAITETGDGTLKQFDMVNKCLETIRYSNIDMMEKLRLENLLIQMKMLLLVDVYKQDAMPEIFMLHNFEELFAHVKAVCVSEVDAEAVQDLVEHVKKTHSAMAAYLNQS
jgi:hypothetical protein